MGVDLGWKLSRARSIMPEQLGRERSPGKGLAPGSVESLHLGRGHGPRRQRQTSLNLMPGSRVRKEGKRPPSEPW